MRFDSPETYVVGIDDTDMPGIGGTGRLVRRMAAEIGAAGAGRSRGVTRHQFYEGPGVPKTARNSAAAVVFTDVTSAPELLAAVCEIVLRESIPGSDPGVAMTQAPLVPPLVGFAREAQAGLVAQARARELAAEHAVVLIGLGGTDDGVIGALGAMALRMDGNDGRFVDLLGIRDVAGVMAVGDVLAHTGVAAVVDSTGGAVLRPGSEVDLGTWVRPRLSGGRPILVARRLGGRWVNADARSK